MGLLNNSNAIESGGYNIDRSLRFRSSASAYLNKVLGTATNTNIWTWSGWIKRGKLGSQAGVFGAGNGTNASTLVFESGDTVSFYYYVSPSFSFKLTTTQVFRDPSAWYHFTLVFDSTQSTASNRVKLYVNGVQVTSFSAATYPTQNTNCYINRNVYAHTLSQEAGYSYYFDGYLAEVNFIDGQALTPSSFGETSTETGAWTPKKYTGTYGTNGFYLDFKDNTSATTLAYDKSGNGNNWTANNISTTAGSTYDSMTDVPTLTSATAANYCVLNPLLPSALTGASTLSYANLRVSGTNGVSNAYARGTMSLSGKFYAEFYFDVVNSTASIGVDSVTATSGALATNSTSVCYRSGGNKRILGTETSYGASWVANDIIGVAVDTTANTIEFFKNGTSQGTITSTSFFAQGASLFAFAADDTGSPLGYANFGQRPFSYTPPTGFKALNTFNLPDPVIKKPNQYMQALTYTGTGATNVINSFNFAPDFAWFKNRSTAEGHALFDTSRGANKNLASNTTNAEGTQTDMLMSFDSNGYTLGSDGNWQVNRSGASYVSWNWKESATSGFDIVTYTGDGTATRNVSHSLGVAPKMIIVKSRSVSSSVWLVGHNDLTWNSALYLNQTVAKQTYAVYWNNTAPTSSVFTLGNWGSDTNGSGQTYVAYLFAEIAGFSKFGSYTGNGSADGPFVYCGFKPRFVMLKNYNAGANSAGWVIIDTARNTSNVSKNFLFPNDSAAESSYADVLDITSNGFKIRTVWDTVNNPSPILYAAFAENPFKYSLAR